MNRKATDLSTTTSLHNSNESHSTTTSKKSNQVLTAELPSLKISNKPTTQSITLRDLMSMSSLESLPLGKTHSSLDGKCQTSEEADADATCGSNLLSQTDARPTSTKSLAEPETTLSLEQISLQSVQEKRIRASVAATLIQATYRRHVHRKWYCRIQRGRSLWQQAKLARKLSPTRHVERTTSEITMSDFGDSRHQAIQERGRNEDDSHHATRASSEAESFYETDSFESMANDLMDSPKTSMMKRSSLENSNDSLRHLASPRRGGGPNASFASLPPPGSATEEEQPYMASTGHRSFTSYFGGLHLEASDTPIQRPERYLSPQPQRGSMRIDQGLLSLPFGDSSEHSTGGESFHEYQTFSQVVEQSASIGLSSSSRWGNDSFQSSPGRRSEHSLYPARPPSRKDSPSDEKLQTPHRSEKPRRNSSADSPQLPLRKESSHGSSPTSCPHAEATWNDNVGSSDLVAPRLAQTCESETALRTPATKRRSSVQDPEEDSASPRAVIAVDKVASPDL